LRRYYLKKEGVKLSFLGLPTGSFYLGFDAAEVHISGNV
jgi:hypothetical protein